MTTHLPFPDLFRSNGRKHTGTRVRVAMERRKAGVVDLPASAEHLVRVQAAPVDGACAVTRFHYSAGDIDILPAGQAEQWEEFSPSVTLALRLPHAILRQAAEHVGIGAALTGLEPRFGLRDPQIQHVAWALNAEHEAAYPSGSIYADFLAMALAVHLLGKYRAPVRVNGGLPNHVFRRVTEYIEEHLDQDLSLISLAALADMSTSHFGVQFKKSAGVPVHEYVIRRRVERAKRLLRDSALPASQIAFDSGFAHQSHMARWMHRILGVSPSQLRQVRQVHDQDY